MNATQKRKASIVASVALALLTLSVFWVARNKGPISTVMRFHDAIGKSNLAAVTSLLVTNDSEPDANILEGFVFQKIQHGASIEVSKVVLNPPDNNMRYAWVYVTYHIGRNDSDTVLFVLQKKGMSWFIDPSSTLRRTLAAYRGDLQS